MHDFLRILAILPLLIPLTVAILNGTTTTDPSIVAIFQPGLALFSSSFICSGVLLNTHTVLTLGECVTGLSPSDLLIRVGSNPSTFQNSTLQSITTYPGFDSDTLSNDIAVLKLASNITIPSAQLCCNGNDANMTAATEVQLAGWGPTTDSVHDISNSAHTATLPVLDQSICARKLSPCFTLDTQHFCTEVQQGEGPAYGDYGGPVFDAAGGVVGLISGNPTCAAEEDVQLVVNLCEFRAWIAEETR